MVRPITRAAATASGSAEGASRDVVEETPPGESTELDETLRSRTLGAGDRSGQGDRMEIDPEERIRDVTDVGADSEDQDDTSGNGPDGQLRGVNAPAERPSRDVNAPAEGPLRDVTLEERLRLLREKKERARIAREIARLEQEEERGFVSEEEDNTAATKSQRGRDAAFRDDILLQRSRHVPDPTFYSGRSQREFETFQDEVGYTFETQPLIYATPESRCRYAGRFLTGIPADDWKNMKNRLEDSPDQDWSYEKFLEMLQDRLNPKHVRQYNLILRLKELKQRNGQSVSELVSYLDSLERQFEPRFADVDLFRNLFAALHTYLQDAVMKRENAVEGRTNLEEVAQVLESTVARPPGITVKKPVLSGRSDTSKPKTSTPRGHAAAAVPARNAPPHPHGEKRKPEEPPNEDRPNKAPRINSVSCYNCGKKGHIRKECPLPRKRRDKKEGNGTGKEGSGKAQGH